MQQAQTQIEILADLENVDVTFLQELLPAAFYVRRAEIQTALATKTSVIYYHLPSLLRVQLVPSYPPLNEVSMFSRLRRLALIDDEPALPVLAPEDLVILTLIRVQQCETEIARQGRKERADDIWNKLLGVLKVQGSDLDLAYIEQQALQHGSLALVIQAFEGAGLKG